MRVNMGPVLFQGQKFKPSIISQVTTGCFPHKKRNKETGTYTGQKTRKIMSYILKTEFIL